MTSSPLEHIPSLQVVLNALSTSPRAAIIEAVLVPLLFHSPGVLLTTIFKEDLHSQVSFEPKVIIYVRGSQPGFCETPLGVPQCRHHYCDQVKVPSVSYAQPDWEGLS